MTYQPTNGFAPFLPTSIYLPQDFQQMLLRLQAYLTEISLKVNDREIGLYEQTELLTGQTWFPSSNADELISQQTFRQVYTFGAIIAGATLNIPNNIVSTNGVTYTHIYGTAFLVNGENRPLPSVAAGVVTNQVLLSVLGGNIIIINGATANDIVSGIVVLEYLKN